MGTSYSKGDITPKGSSGKGIQKPSGAPPPRKTRGTTKIEMETFEFTWTINHFPVWLNNMAKRYDEKKKSPTFTTGEHKWCLMKQDPKGHKEHLSMFLMPVASPKPKVLAGFTLSILNEDGERVYSDYIENEYYDFKELQSWGWDEYISKDELLNKDNHYLSSNDTLTFLCEVNVFSDPLPVSENLPQVILADCHLAGSLASVLQAGHFSDITLVVGEKEFPSYKVILAAASPVFAAMLQHAMKEKLENRVEIEDIDLPTFEDFLHFIHTGEVNDLEKNAEALLVVAERYGVERLKTICEDFFANQLSVENAVHLYSFANLHNAKQLKAIAGEFLKKHSVEISKSDEFHSLIKDNPHLLMDIFQKMLLADENNS